MWERIREWLADFQAPFAVALIVMLLADVIHFADGHSDCRWCPYPWGPRRGAERVSALLGEPRDR